MLPLAVLYPLTLLALAIGWWLFGWWQLYREHREAAANVIEGRDLDKARPATPEPFMLPAGPYRVLIDREYGIERRD